MSTSDLALGIQARRDKVLETIAAAARRAGRTPDSVRLVVVTKGQPVPVVEAAVEAGARVLGENYVDEAESKMQAIQRRCREGAPENGRVEAADGSSAVEWHMIGHIQSRKAQIVARYFDLVHSVDSVKLAQRLDRAARELGRTIPVLLEFNVGGEVSKHGWKVSHSSEWPLLLGDMEAILKCVHLNVRGLMTMPPLMQQPEVSRAYFRRLRDLREFLLRRIQASAWPELSMGTSADYDLAVEEGATLVRIGEAILGSRPLKEDG